jgi:hypothetical protein
MSDTIDVSSTFNDTSTYTDLIIHYGPLHQLQLDCHRYIVCPQSKFFKKGCDDVATQLAAEYKKAGCVVFTLHQKYDPHTVKDVLSSLYHPADTTYEWLQTCVWSQLFRIYELARLLQVKGLVEATEAAIKETLLEMSENEDWDLQFAKAIIESTPYLKDGFKEELAEFEIDEAVRALGSFTIE